jgi:hypothetical protein
MTGTIQRIAVCARNASIERASTALPAKCLYCFGIPSPTRVPAPAATTITAMDFSRVKGFPASQHLTRRARNPSIGRPSERQGRCAAHRFDYCAGNFLN